MECTPEGTNRFNKRGGITSGMSFGHLHVCSVDGQVDRGGHAAIPTDDTVLRSEMGEQVEESLKRWRYALDNRDAFRIKLVLSGYATL